MTEQDCYAAKNESLLHKEYGIGNKFWLTNLLDSTFQGRNQD